MSDFTYDFSGWATKNNLKCSDGRTILKDAFKVNDGQTVPLIWNHSHGSPFSVLGHALLVNKPEGVMAYCKFNETEQGQNAKLLLDNGDVDSLSIYANQLVQRGGDVLHGNIREVSLVLAGANPEAKIDFESLAHGDDEDDEILAEIYTGESIELYHADIDKKEEMDKKMDDEEKKVDESDETIEDVFNTLTDKQKTAVYAIVGAALEKNEDEDEDKNMKHNVFDMNRGYTSNGIIEHSDQESILELAKSTQVGTFQTALKIYEDDNNLQHDAVEIAGSSGFPQTGNGNVTWLFPEYKDVRPGAPELITNDQGWISVVMNKVHKSPISRIRTGQVDIRNIDALRAKGYKKGTKKSLTGNFSLVRRTTDPQTVYVKNALHRDDIIDITDFDYVQYLYNIDRMMLNEELATAIMLGDGRQEGDPDKIDPAHIRPIWTDDELYTLHVDLDITAARKELQGTGTGVSFGDNYIYAEAMINTVLYARENFKGTGTPDFYCTPHLLNVMLLARDMNGRRIYSSKAELATALNVGQIVTAEQFANKTRTATVNGSEVTKKLLGIICNLSDYSLGATKGGQVTHFTQFDIDFNQEKSLLETRVSGALTRVYSAIAIEEPVVTSGSSTEEPEEEP